MLKTIAGFDRIGEENAFAVLARAMQLSAQVATSSISASVSPISARRISSSKRRSRRCATAITAIRPRSAFCRCARRSRPISTSATAVKVSPDEVMIFPGGKPTMFMSIMMFGEPGADILYPDPGFPIYRSMIEFTGARPIPVPIREENEFAFSAEETLRLITPQTRLLIVNSPANPTGGVTPKSEVDKLVAGLERFPDVAVMSDEIYDHMVYDGETPCLFIRLSVDPRPSHPAQWLVEDLCHDRLAARLCGVAGQTLRPSAQARGQPALVRQRLGAICRPCGADRTAGRSGEDGGRIRQQAQNRGRRFQRLPGMSCATPKGAFYAFPNIKRAGWKAKALAAALLEDAGVALIGGPDFGILGEGYMRVSYANSTENILKALDRMGEFLASRKAA